MQNKRWAGNEGIQNKGNKEQEDKQPLGRMLQ